MPHPGPISHRTALTPEAAPALPAHSGDGNTPLAANAHYVAVPVMHLEHNAVASRRRTHRRPDGERASLGEVLRALTGAYRGSVVLRLQECYMTRGAMVKKSTGSCLLGWACDPGPFGQHRPAVLRQASPIGGNYPAGPVANYRIGHMPVLERWTELAIKVSVGRVGDRDHDTGGRSGHRRRRRTCQD
jgi:hypothetical protein